MNSEALLFTVADRYDQRQPFPRIEWDDTYDFSFEEFHRIMQNYGMAHDDDTAQLLFEAGCDGPGDGYIVELGTEHGHGACYLAAGSKVANREKVITVDNNKGEPLCLYSTRFWDQQPMRQARLYMNLLMAGVYDWVIPVCCSSKLAAQILDVRVRALFVDANHDYEHCTADTLLWTPKLIAGAVVIYHDYDAKEVKDAVRDCIAASALFSDVKLVGERTAVCVKL